MTKMRWNFTLLELEEKLNGLQKARCFTDNLRSSIRRQNLIQRNAACELGVENHTLDYGGCYDDNPA